jgi:PEP-CTERM motif
MCKRPILLGLFLAAFGTLASASTITWALGGANTDLGTSKVFDSSPSGLTITAYGFSSAGHTAEIFGKNGGGDEHGLGLDLSGEPDHEISDSGFLQLDISNLVGHASDFQFAMGSTTGVDAWTVLGSNTKGTPGTTVLASGSNEGSHTITPVGTWNYLAFEATRGDVLLGSVSADSSGIGIQAVPEPGYAGLMGLGLIGTVAFRRAKLAR